MKWSAQITSKSEVNSSNELTYEFVMLCDEKCLSGVYTVTGSPNDIQQLIADKVTAYAQAYEAAEDLPVVGDVLEVIK